MKRRMAALLTIALMGVLLRSGLRDPSPKGSAAIPSEVPDDAQAKVRALLLDASEGDVPGYLAAFAPPLRDRLGREVEEKGRVAFAESLRTAARARKGHAVFAPEADGPDVARVAVESIYPDRIERQTYRLERAGGGWLVADVETVRAHRPQARFGTPASYREPEGVPVPVEIPTEEEGPPID